MCHQNSKRPTDVPSVSEKMEIQKYESGKSLVGKKKEEKALCLPRYIL